MKPEDVLPEKKKDIYPKWTRNDFPREATGPKWDTVEDVGKLFRIYASLHRRIENANFIAYILERIISKLPDGDNPTFLHYVNNQLHKLFDGVGLCVSPQYTREYYNYFIKTKLLYQKSCTYFVHKEIRPVFEFLFGYPYRPTKVPVKNTINLEYFVQGYTIHSQISILYDMHSPDANHITWGKIS